VSSVSLPATVQGGRPRRAWRNRFFTVAMLFCMFVAFGTLIVLLVDTFVTGWPALSSQLLTGLPSTVPAEAGARPAILATLELMAIVIAFGVPVGVGTAIYLEEFADGRRWYNRLLEINIQNLAAVPSIVYGILGLGFLVHGANLGRVVLAGGLILTLLVLPTIIIAAREAIRSVPQGVRLGAFALGATQWQVVSRQVLPAAIPGIATGSILALSRAIGESAPLLLVGALLYAPRDPTLLSGFVALPVQIYNWVRLPQEEFHGLAAAAIVVLLGLLLTMNAVAILLRNRFQRRW
jgi:phosphate transport system permease protein